MQHKSFLILSIFLTFFIVSAMEEERCYCIASKQRSNSNISQSQSTTHHFTEEKLEKLEKIMQEKEDNEDQKVFAYQEHINAHLKATLEDDFSCIETSHEQHKKDLMEESIQKFPNSIQHFFNRIKQQTQIGKDIYENKTQRFLNLNFLTLFGYSESFNKSLATTIPQYCKLPYTIIECSKLPNQYINSEKSRLQEIITSLLDIPFAQVIILNNLHMIIKKYNGEKDESAAHTLCDLFDRIKERKNILVITTANEVSELPSRLRQRLYKNEIKLPSYQNRINKIIFHINKIQQKIPCNISFSDIEYLARRSNGFSIFDFYRMFAKAKRVANKRYNKNIENNQSATLTINNNDLFKSFLCIRNRYKIEQPWYTIPHAIITPLIIPALHIGIPLSILLFQIKQS